MTVLFVHSHTPLIKCSICPLRALLNPRERLAAPLVSEVILQNTPSGRVSRMAALHESMGTILSLEEWHLVQKLIVMMTVMC